MICKNASILCLVLYSILVSVFRFCFFRTCRNYDVRVCMYSVYSSCSDWYPWKTNARIRFNMLWTFGHSLALSHSSLVCCPTELIRSWFAINQQMKNELNPFEIELLHHVHQLWQRTKEDQTKNKPFIRPTNGAH